MQTSSPPSAHYLDPTYFLDYDTPSVSEFAAATCGAAADARSRAVALYYAVRDRIRYDAYRIDFSRPGLRASRALQDGFGFCISKAALLAAAARAQGIPARLGFGDVRNHLSTERLRRAMKTDVFMFHGYTELWLDGRWVKATPAFNIELCTKFGVRPLEFDGRSDSLFHPYTADGKLHMEYLRDRGVFDDIPYELIRATWDAQMAGSVDDIGSGGDFAEDGARERAARETP